MKKTITMLMMIFMSLSCSNGVNDLIDNLGNSVPICVKSDATGTGDGRGWANAYTTIQAAVNAADAGAEIWVAGTFTVGMDINKQVYLYGGFNGTESKRDDRDLNNKTEIDTGITTINADNVSMDGFKFNGSRTGAALQVLSGSSCSLKNCEFENNTSTANSGGGAIYCQPSSTIEIINTVFTGNTTSSGYAGGAIYCSGSKLTISGCTFDSNTANSSRGGAIYCEALNVPFTPSDVQINETTFINNKASGNQPGGAIYCAGSSVKIRDSVFEKNNCGSATAGLGGAICSESDNNLQITSTIFNDNSTNSQNGGAICSTNSKLSIVNSIFNSNSSPAIAGAIYIQGKDGFNSPNVIVNSTFYNNTGSTLTGAIYNLGETTLYLYNSIFWSNAESYYVYGGTTVLYNNAADDGENTAGDSFNPQSLTSSPFVSTTPGSEDFRLAAGSNCINKGLNINTGDIPGFTMPATDLAGNPRIAGGTIDIGAYERQ